MVNHVHNALSQPPYLHHEVLDGFLQVVNAATHLVYSPEDGVGHLAEPILLQRLLISFVPTDPPPPEENDHR